MQQTASFYHFKIDTFLHRKRIPPRKVFPAQASSVSTPAEGRPLRLEQSEGCNRDQSVRVIFKGKRTG